MPAFTHHIFICSNQRDCQHARGCCDPTGKDELREAFKQGIKERKLGPLVRGNKAGCLEQCELGPVVAIYPQGIFYGNVTIADVPRILDETVIKGILLDDLLITADELNNPNSERAIAKRQLIKQQHEQQQQ